MSKKIISVGFEIPSNGENLCWFHDEKSLSDFDIAIFSAPSFRTDGEIISGGQVLTGTYGKNFNKNIGHRKKEITAFLEAGKNIYVLLGRNESFGIESYREHKTKVTIVNSNQATNYDFLPITMGVKNSAGTVIKTLNPQFNEYNKLDPYYDSYIENIQGVDDIKKVFSSNDDTKNLGSICKYRNGSIIFLPMVNYNKDGFTEERNGENYRTNDAIKRGKQFLSIIANVDKVISLGSEKTPIPQRVSEETNFLPQSSKNIIKSIDSYTKKIEILIKKVDELTNVLHKSNVILDLLYEQGKPLETAVIYALRVLGFSAEGYDDGVLELDQVITSPEGNRYIGECEGKDNKGIDISKYRQLLESINRDFDREDVQEKAKGILFGNPQRLLNLVDRKEDFTEKLKTGAKSDQIALIRTIDLFFVTKYLLDTSNKKYAQDCRIAIEEQRGGIVCFPEMPK